MRIRIPIIISLGDETREPLGGVGEFLGLLTDSAPVMVITRAVRVSERERRKRTRGADNLLVGRLVLSEKCKKRTRENRREAAEEVSLFSDRLIGKTRLALTGTDRTRLPGRDLSGWDRLANLECRARSVK